MTAMMVSANRIVNAVGKLSFFLLLLLVLLIGGHAYGFGGSGLLTRTPLSLSASGLRDRNGPFSPAAFALGSLWLRRTNDYPLGSGEMHFGEV